MPHSASDNPDTPLGARIVMKQALLRAALLAWFDASARDLPWRRTRDPYAVWVSEILLQQTRVDQGTPYYERFMAAFPTVQALAAAPLDDVLKAWEGLGYYGRARHLHQAARQIAGQRGGAFPATSEEWRALPGVGRYTAGAVASIALGEAVPVLDGNVKRVLSRVFDFAACIDTSAAERQLWEWAAALVPPDRPGDFNQALMELGARLCSPKNPECGACPIADCCDAKAAGTQDQRPLRKPKKQPPQREHVVAAIRNRDRYLIGQRRADGLLGGLWELPSWEVQPGETHQDALIRAGREELGVALKPGGLVAAVKHTYSHFRVTLNVYRCRIEDGEPASARHTRLRWVRPVHFRRYAVHRAHQKFLELL